MAQGRDIADASGMVIDSSHNLDHKVVASQMSRAVVGDVASTQRKTDFRNPVPSASAAFEECLAEEIP